MGDILHVKGVHVALGLNQVREGVNIKGLLEAYGDQPPSGGLRQAFGGPTKQATSIPNSSPGTTLRPGGSPALTCIPLLRESEGDWPGSDGPGFAQPLPCLDPDLHESRRGLGQEVVVQVVQGVPLCRSTAWRAASNEALEHRHLRGPFALPAVSGTAGVTTQAANKNPANVLGVPPLHWPCPKPAKGRRKCQP